MSEQQTEQSSAPREVARAIVGVTRKHAGRGATTVRTEVGRDAITVILEDTQVTAERALVDAGEEDHVRETRDKLQQVMRQDMVAAVEEILGRRVIAFMSDQHIDPDMAVEVFVLESGTNGSSGDGSAQAD